jgi:prepilin-type N-terminal cleavage/methylation domain-containing protein
MKKGFTLVELLAVIVILTIILVIVIPSVQDAIEESKQKAYNVTVESIEDAAKSYLYFNSGSYKDEFTASGHITVDIQLLKDEGFLKQDIRNPKNDEYIDGHVIITYVSANKYTYEFVEE